MKSYENQCSIYLMCDLIGSTIQIAMNCNVEDHDLFTHFERSEKYFLFIFKLHGESSTQGSN